MLQQWDNKEEKAEEGSGREGKEGRNEEWEEMLPGIKTEKLEAELGFP